MALRDQPYMPLYIKDFMTDEKLAECSADATGVYIRLMCLMHKSEHYGKIELKAKYKQNKSKVECFSDMLVRHLPFTPSEVSNGLQELVANEVCYIEGDFLCQKRMVKDGNTSAARSQAGSKGGKVGRNSGTKRYYNEPGYLYLIYDEDDCNAFKVGISKDPEKRILGIIRKCGRTKLKFRRRWQVDDMGLSEQAILDFFDDIRDGEWIFGSYKIEEIECQIDNILKSKTKAKQNQNTAIENAYAFEDEIDKKEKEGVGEGEKVEASGIWSTDIPQDIKLNEVQIGQTTMFISLSCKVDLTEQEVENYFEAFKIQNLGKKQWYNDISDLFTHFRNSLKIDFKNGKANRTSVDANGAGKKGGTSTDRLEALKKWG